MAPASERPLILGLSRLEPSLTQRGKTCLSRKPTWRRRWLRDGASRWDPDVLKHLDLAEPAANPQKLN